MSNYNLKAIKQTFKQKGIFYTPKKLALQLKSYLDFEPREVYDPTCGDGELLSVFDDSVKKYGQEINQKQLENAKNKLVNFEGICGDTLLDPAFQMKKFECILANPPFSIEWNPIIDERFKYAPCIPTKSKADYAFILHCLHYLSDMGTAVILSFPGILYRGQKEKQIRQWLVEQNYIDKVIAIPSNTFVDTKIATVVLVLKKYKIHNDILFIDEELKQKQIISFEEIKANDFTLSVNSYILKKEQKEEIDIKELNYSYRKEIIKSLKSSLEVQKMICELEGWNFIDCVMEVKNFIDEYYQSFIN